LTDRDGLAIGRFAARGISAVISDYSARHDLMLSSFPSAEAQLAAIADDIAYDAHDIDDGLRAGLFTLDELAVVPFIDGIIREIDAAYVQLDEFRRAHEVVRRIITRMIEDVIVDSARRIEVLSPASVDDIRGAAGPVAGFSPAMVETDRAIKDFLKPKMYRHERVMRVMTRAEGVLHDLFDTYARDPAELPAERRHDLSGDAGARSRQIANFIAGMTDRYALIEHVRIFDSTPELR
jgi:dGTPase